MKYFIVIFLMGLSLTLFMPGCQTTRLPQWVKQHPVHPDYYTGVGIARKLPGQTDYVARARDEALNEIASNIAINIMSESTLKTIQEAGVLKETFEANITSTTKAMLEGYELVETWENEKEFRAYYRLSKRLHQENMKRRLMQVAERASRYFDEGKRAEANGNLTMALSNYLQAACEVASNWGMGLPRTGGLPGEFIDAEIFHRLRKILSQVEIMADPAVITVKFLETPENPIKLTALYRKGSGELIAFSGLPISCELLNGKAELLPIRLTSPNGESELVITRTLSAGLVQVVLSPDLKGLCSCNHECFSQPIFQVLPVPKSVITIQVPPVLVAFQTDEINLGVKQSYPVSSAMVGEAMTSKGWKVVNTGQSSDFIIKMNISAKPGTERMGVHTAFADGSLALIQSNSGEEIFIITNNQVPGGGRNYESAGRQAIEKLTEWFILELHNRFH